MVTPSPRNRTSRFEWRDLFATRYAILTLLSAIAILIPVLGLAPQPGSKDDPIITRAYAESRLEWRKMNLPQGVSLSIQPGGEFVIIPKAPGDITVSPGFQSGNLVLNLTSGSYLTSNELIPNNHYLYVGDGPIEISFEADTLLIGKMLSAK